MFQQLINPIKLKAVTNSTYVLQNRIFSDRYKMKKCNNLTLKVQRSVSYEVFKNSLLPKAYLVFLIVLESNLCLDYVQA